ncbi:SRPBCC family protein [Nocardia sp. XZ_19_385]|uniref:SRPBCC family protein n=1 Tax=Nocardia sp. XZ_19_385 TaxID=2769488 RepID=UPI00188E4147|nr:SRPBCC family protein [Nocardia sp. XZ_19_385]
MAWVKKEIVIEAPVEDVWAVVRDFEHGPARMVPGFVTESKLVEPDVRVVTFVTGAVVRERLISHDDAEHRYAFAVIGDTVTPEHDSASMQVFALDNGHSRFVWMHDVLPAELADAFGAVMEQGIAMFKKTVESA